jgi:hypothetical protein
MSFRWIVEHCAFDSYRHYGIYAHGVDSYNNIIRISSFYGHYYAGTVGIYLENCIFTLFEAPTLGANTLSDLILTNNTLNLGGLNTIIRGDFESNCTNQLTIATDNNFIGGGSYFNYYTSKGINFESTSHNNIVEGCIIRNSKDAYAIYDNGENNSIQGNFIQYDWTNLYRNPSGTGVSENNRFEYGFQECKGTHAIGAGSNTTCTFNHQLAGTPAFVFASFSQTGYGTWKWTATSTQITITIQTSVTMTIYWWAML